jgi:hypothetical protein
MSPLCVACSCAATHEFPNILRNPNVHYRVRALVSNLSQIDPKTWKGKYMKDLDIDGRVILEYIWKE